MSDFKRVHRCGDVRSDGYVFQSYYARNGKWNEKWKSPDSFYRWKQTCRKKAKEQASKRGKSPVLLKQHAQAESERRKNPEYLSRLRSYQRAWTRRRCSTDPAFRVLKLSRKRIWDALNGSVKAARTTDLIGCSSSQLVAHLEALFKPGMSWQNYGVRGWHVDHVKPCADFDLSDPEQQLKCFHYSNLQPLWAHENLTKSCN